MPHPLINQILNQHNHGQRPHSSGHGRNQPNLLLHLLEFDVPHDPACLPPNAHIYDHRVQFDPFGRDLPDARGRD